MSRFNRSIILIFTILLFECSSIQHQSRVDWVGYTESGKASFYADKHQFKKTASGELYNRDLKTAAHKSIPFGSTVKVTNIRNRKSVVVKINDRGPFVKGRIIDLSKAAFSRIGKLSSGVINVRIEVLK